jgi:TRAP-type C4-dicarboxylate transport system substrate-binding protein
MKHNKFLFLAIFGMVLIIALMGVLVACGTNKTVTNTVTAAAPTATATTTATTTATSTATVTATATKTVKPITLIFSSHDREGGVWAETYDPFFAEIEERTNGGIKIEQHWNGELAGFFESYATCAEGTVDMTQTEVQMYPNVFPMEDLTTLVSPDSMTWGRSQLWQELTDISPVLQQAFTAGNVKLLFRTCNFPCHATMRTGAAIRSFADFKGKKFLTTGKYDSLKWEALGMVPVSMMPDETFMNLQTGVIDGVYFDASSIWDFGMEDIIKSITYANFAGGVFSCIMNLDTWNSLPAEYQQIITEAAAKVPALKDAIQWRLNDEYLAKAEEKGMEYIELPQSDLVKITESLYPIREMWLKEMEDKGLPGQQLMDDMLRLEKKYSGDEYKPK